ncbi:unnamed protein product [Lathyrus sativus]|nr:unnamed protein product [Lathyrus sativus]
MEGDKEVYTYDGLEVYITNAIDALWKRFKSFDVAGKRALKSKVCKIAYPTTTRMCPPLEGVKRKGKKPAGYDVYHDPSYHEPFIDDIVNVKSDGNCGFIVIASFHGYG